MSQWGETFTITGVKVVPHVVTSGFQPIDATSVIDDFAILDKEPHADEHRARELLRPFRGKTYGELMKFLAELAPIATPSFAGVTFLTHYSPTGIDGAVVTDIRCPKCGIPIEFDEIEYPWEMTTDIPPRRKPTGEVIVTVSCHGESWRVSSKRGKLP